MRIVNIYYLWAHKRAKRILKIDFFRFAIVGSVGFIINAIFLRILHGSFDLQITLATLIGSELGLLSNFFFHEHWTYNGVDHHYKSITKKFINFHMSSWSGVVLIALLETLGVKVLGVNYLVSLVFASGITLFWNFFWTKYFIFNGKTPSILHNPEDTIPEKELQNKR